MKLILSIIIPVYNDAENLNLVLKALENQTFPKEKFEIIVIDNGSTDNTCKITKKNKHAQLLKEHNYLNSPYSARNRGVEQAKGEVILLLDATCRPTENFLEKGINCLKTDADLVSGDVKFNFQNNITVGKLYDSLTNIKIEESIKKRSAVPTACLFIKREVFKKIGLFPEGIRSGGDLRWTRQATKNGYKLAFCEKAIALKPARNTSALVKKQWRVSKGQPSIWLEEGKEVNLLYLVLRLVYNLFTYPFRSNILNKVESSGYNINKWQKLKLRGFNYGIQILMLTGNIVGYMSNSIFNRK